MKILVISDTHIPQTAKALPKEIENETKNCSCCIHAGDLASYEVFKALSSLTKTYAVCGNMDDKQIRRSLPGKIVLNFEGVKAGIIHGEGHPSGLIDYIGRSFGNELKNIDIVIFGHSHQPLDKKINGKIYFNPGSPTDKLFAPYRSYGILEIENSKTKRRIIKIG